MKKAFTLTELLIALTVVGVLVAITLPISRKFIPNQNTVMAKKAFYMVQTAVEELINDSDCYPDKSSAQGDERRVGFDDGFGYENCEWGGQIATDTKETAGDSIEKFRTLFIEKIGQNSGEELTVLTSAGPYHTAEGMDWFIGTDTRVTETRTETRMEKRTEKQMVTKTRPVTKTRNTGEYSFHPDICKSKVSEYSTSATCNCTMGTNPENYRVCLYNCINRTAQQFTYCCDVPNANSRNNCCLQTTQEYTLNSYICYNSIEEALVEITEEYTDYEEYQEEEDVEVEVPVEYEVEITTSDMTIAVDVNGSSKGSNCAVSASSFGNIQACTAGKTPDIFRIYVKQNGNVVIHPSDTWAINAVKFDKKLTE